MYNKYRTQFEVIHALEKEISIPQPLIAELLLDGEPCSRTVEKAGSLWVTGINARGSAIIIIVDA